MTMRDSNKVFMPSLVAVACLVAMGVAKAETPLSLTVSESLTYDSNILKDNSRKYRDAVSVTGLRLGFDKAYGRQTYKLSGTALASRYKNTKDYDNDGYNVNLGLTSSLLSNWFTSLDLTAVSQQQNPEDQGNNRYKEVVKSEGVRAFVQYGMYGRWSVNGAYNFDKNRYETIKFYDRDSRRARLGLRYSPTDLLYFDFGLGKTKVDNSRYPLINNSGRFIYGDPVDRYDFDVSSRWIVTGFSSLNARLAWTREKHANDSRRNFNGLTGRLAWTYTPAGKVSYDVAIDRDTNNAGGSSFSTGTGITVSGGDAAYRAQSRVSTGLTAKATWNATAKVSVNSALTYRQIKEESESVINPFIAGLLGVAPNSGSKTSGSYRAMSIGFTYALHRSTSLGCNVEKYDRGLSLFGREYNGESVECNVVFSID